MLQSCGDQLTKLDVNMIIDFNRNASQSESPPAEREATINNFGEVSENIRGSNPNVESRNPKQIRMLKIRMTKTKKI